MYAPTSSPIHARTYTGMKCTHNGDAHMLFMWVCMQQCDILVILRTGVETFEHILAYSRTLALWHQTPRF